jgi:PIN domain nuclease of toxin-antitoxin system
LALFPWLDRYRPWGVSPVSFLELQFLHEVGRLELRAAEFIDAVANDTRFLLDDPPLLTVALGAMSMGWTREPFDRLMAAHSASRRIDLCTTDRLMREHHRFIVRELRFK